MQLDAFAEVFSDLHDPRQSAKIAYPLFDIVFLMLGAVIGGSEGWEDIEDFGQDHYRWYQALMGWSPLPQTASEWRCFPNRCCLNGTN